MSRELEQLPQHGRVLIAPVLHYSLEYADAVRALIERWQPEAIVVELPGTLEPHLRRAVRRLPQLSVILYVSARGEPVYLPVEPCDALVESVRSGLERGIPVVFGDLDVDEFPLYAEPFPDGYSVYRLGLSALWQAYHEACPRPVRGEADRRRELSLAHHAQQVAAEAERVLLVCGMAHVAGVVEALATPQP
ncbi:MAG: hypothetical protein HUU35_03735, partial [Armatimonadetes bacterium]|nr:hypothetical protein [Armatimonadota bacterium]